MKFLLKLSFKNLARQKRRNTLLGIGIGFGMMILVIANSFSNGLVDVLINEIIANITGHVSIISTDNNVQILHNKDKIDNVLSSFDNQIESIDENIVTFTKVIGNNKSDNIIIAGIPNEKEKWSSFMEVIDGSMKEFGTNTYLYPIVISPEKAKKLNVKVGDIVKAQLNMVTGQVQSANMQVIAIVKSSNSFMNIIAFMEIDKFKKLLGYKVYEAGSYKLTIKNPKLNAKKIANEIHDMLKPNILSVIGEANNIPIKLFAYENDKNTYKSLFNKLNIIKGKEENYLSKNGVLISKNLSKSLKIDIGDNFLYSYDTLYKGKFKEKLKVEGIFKNKGKFKDDIVLVNAERIYKNYNSNLPKNTLPNYFDSNDVYYNSLAKEYFLYNRVNSAKEYRQIQREERRKKSKRLKLNVVTMYEASSDIIMIEKILSSITWIVVLVLVFIILIGVINTLRMSIKERTREIGTIRAIGMQANDVKNIFILESIYLSIISCIIGTIFGIIISKTLSFIRIDSTSPLSFILKNSKISFIYDIKEILFNIILITFITALTAYFPAKKASKMNAANALKHYE